MMKKKYILFACFFLIFILGAYYLLGDPKLLPLQKPPQLELPRKKVARPPVAAPRASPSPVAIVVDDSRSIQNCQELLEKYARSFALENLADRPNASERFRNRHLEYNGEIYRLRSFYDDANEGEQLTFIVYREDDEEFAHIKEKSTLVKGVLYRQFEELLAQGEAEVIYDEVGMTLREEGSPREDFYHYKNGKLVGVQGQLEGRHLECLGQ